jgi:mannose-6-phosphate isomerase-like protein (cupin superfamily)
VVPGVSTQLHGVSDTAERYVIIEGTGEVEIGGEPPVGVQPMDVVTIPAGVSQRISNTGAGELVFLCICTPRFLRENYLDLEAGAERP